ncbi:GNAT family N-acetyltransferase [Bradyrhizobium jicamae]|uniref:GNAT family N-acetyltransferase n=1 Tax=Bradyrhizobium jicamae TaxID=280332 RepID=UPI001BA69CE4|nr:GNAT family N-acetyltransferase [Bradyrhizobium jicamae]MBR0751680.1 GNAT family N-acetyltransferase [Bradyrhizobium jicamae]
MATPADAKRLFEIRRTSILGLAPSGMSVEAVELWATSLTLIGMKRKLRDLEIWVAEHDGTTAGWGAIRGDTLEGLYTAPECAGRGVGAGLLAMLEDQMRKRGVAAVCAEASSNALNFYLRRGYRANGPQTPEGAWPIVKQL